MQLGVLGEEGASIAKQQDDKKEKVDRRESILQAAADLFREKGYEDVSMRNIADALGISVGNLTYYFKYKEDLIEEVILREYESYEKPKTPEGLAGMHHFFVAMLKYAGENDVYFGALNDALLTDRVKEVRRGVSNDFYAAVREGFASLERTGAIPRAEPYDQREHLFTVMKIIVSHPEGRSREEQLSLLWSLITPMLTLRGKRAFRGEVLARRRA